MGKDKYFHIPEEEITLKKDKHEEVTTKYLVEDGSVKLVIDSYFEGWIFKTDCWISRKIQSPEIFKEKSKILAFVSAFLSAISWIVTSICSIEFLPNMALFFATLGYRNLSVIV